VDIKLLCCAALTGYALTFCLLSWRCLFSQVVAAANNIIKLAGDEDGMEVEGDAPMAELEAAVAFVEQATQALVEAASNLS
jgi:hypothetical protein